MMIIAPFALIRKIVKIFLNVFAGVSSLIGLGISSYLSMETNSDVPTIIFCCSIIPVVWLHYVLTSNLRGYSAMMHGLTVAILYSVFTPLILTMYVSIALAIFIMVTLLAAPLCYVLGVLVLVTIILLRTCFVIYGLVRMVRRCFMACL